MNNLLVTKLLAPVVVNKVDTNTEFLLVDNNLNKRSITPCKPFCFCFCFHLYFHLFLDINNFVVDIINLYEYTVDIFKVSSTIWKKFHKDGICANTNPEPHHCSPTFSSPAPPSTPLTNTTMITSFFYSSNTTDLVLSLESISITLHCLGSTLNKCDKNMLPFCKIPFRAFRVLV